jgi:hypothetical protein
VIFISKYSSNHFAKLTNEFTLVNQIDFYFLSFCYFPDRDTIFIMQSAI